MFSAAGFVRRVGTALIRQQPVISLAPSWVAPSFSTTSLPWKKLDAREREAWKVLGWTEQSWSGDAPAPPSDTALWGELSIGEQAALTHGLGYTSSSWDAELLEGDDDDDDDDDDRGGDSVVHSSSSSSSSGAGGGRDLAAASGSNGLGTRSKGIVSSLFGAASAAARVVDTANAVSESQDIFTAIKEASASSVTLASGYETLIYLDDSGSMMWGKRLGAGQKALGSILDILRGGADFTQRSRVLLFGSGKSELKGRDDGLDVLDPKALRLQWCGVSGGTYLWHMVFNDVQLRYQPGPGTLRVVVVTDGEDMLSPGEFNGMRGMDPLMSGLLARGYRIEWNIVVLGLDDRSPEAKRFSDLCGATGGSFLSLANDDFSANHAGPKRFLGTLRRAVRDGEAVAAEQRRAFEKKIGATKFNWYAQLPPPPGKK